MRELCVVVPTYNERENLSAIVQAILEAMPDACILVVDDASPDGTGELADELASKNDRLSVLHRPAKDGLAGAYIAGFRRALADPTVRLVVQMDADFSHDPASLPALVRPVGEQGFDFAIGSRYVAGGGTRDWGVTRQLMSRGGSLYASLVLGVGVNDLTAGFKCWRRGVLETIGLDRIQARGYGFQIEMTYRAIRHGYRCKEIPITFADRKRGTSKMSRAIMVEALGLVWKLRLGGVGA